MNTSQTVRLDGYESSLRGRRPRSGRRTARGPVRQQTLRAFYIAVLVLDALLFLWLLQSGIHVQFQDPPHALPQPAGFRIWG
jgi:hypothetical protein